MDVVSWALNPKLGHLEANLATVERCVREEDADLHLFPELFLTGYNIGDDVQRLALDSLGLEVQRLAALAMELDTHIIVGAPRKGRLGQTYNSALCLDAGGGVHWVDKHHLPTFTTFQEGLFFTPGEDQPIWDTRLGRIGIGICYDLYFPELAKAQALHGADILVNISASPLLSKRFFQALLDARAIENACFQLYSNNVGPQDGLIFWGGSRLVGPRGELLAETPAMEEGHCRASIDLADLQVAREFRPTLRDTQAAIS